MSALPVVAKIERCWCLATIPSPSLVAFSYLDLQHLRCYYVMHSVPGRFGRTIVPIDMSWAAPLVIVITIQPRHSFLPWLSLQFCLDIPHSFSCCCYGGVRSLCCRFGIAVIRLPCFHPICVQNCTSLLTSSDCDSHPLCNCASHYQSPWPWRTLLQPLQRRTSSVHLARHGNSRPGGSSSLSNRSLLVRRPGQRRL